MMTVLEHLRDLSQEGGSSAKQVRVDRQHLVKKDIFGFESGDPRMRHFVLLRSQIMSGFHARDGRVLVVTSTQPGNGKSFIAANLATSLCQIQPTVMIDLDLRRPTLSDRFGVEVQFGIDDYLLGECELEDVAQQVEGVDLTLFPVRTPRLESSSLLSSGRLAVGFKALRSRAPEALHIIDTPPALVLDDVMLTARHADGVLLVVEEGATNSSELKEAVSLLAPTPIVGTVLNKSITAGSAKSYADGYYSAA